MISRDLRVNADAERPPQDVMGSRKVVTPSFDVVRRGEVIKTVPVHRSRLIVGAEDGADLRLKHPAIANRHVEITVVEGRYLEATNLAGEGRVLLGGQPMDRARLREGDELDLGPVSLRLSYSRNAKPPADLAKPPASASAQEDEPTDADGEAPTDREDEAATALRQDTPPPTVAPGSGSRLGPRKRGPAPVGSGEPVGSVDLDLDDIVLDPTPVVTIEPPGGRPQKVPLRVGTFVVGAGRCAFRLSYAGVGPAHAEMMVMPDGLVYLKHLAGAGQVTLRNGAPIQFSRWKSGDRVQVGPVSLYLEMVHRAQLAAALAEPGALPVAAPPPKPSSAALPRLEPEPPPRFMESSSADDVAPPFATLPAARPSVARAAPLAPASPAAAPPLTPFAAEPLRAPRSAEAPTALASPPPPPPTAAPAVLSAAGPLVRVRGKGTPPVAARPPAQARSALVTTNTVSVSLDVRASDTYAAHARDQFQVDDAPSPYRPPLWQRAAGPVLVAVLLLVIGAQAWLSWKESQDPEITTQPVTAHGVSGLERASIQGERVDSGPLVVGNPRRSPRGAASGGPSRDDEWVPDAEGRFANYDDPRAGTDALAQLAAARADAGLQAQRAEEDEEPAEAAGRDGEGYVEMKDVEKVIWTQRKALRYCYTTAKEDDPGLHGVMWLALTLAQDGRIRGAVIEPRSQIKNEALLGCLKRQLSTMSMPTPRGGSVTFSYPFEMTE